jgi:hypothetical protein
VPPRSGQLADAVGTVLDRAQRARGVLAEGSPGFGGHHPASGADEQVRAERPLELADLLRDRGLGHPQGLGGRGERAELERGAEQRICWSDKSWAVLAHRQRTMRGDSRDADAGPEVEIRIGGQRTTRKRDPHSVAYADAVDVGTDRVDGPSPVVVGDGRLLQGAAESPAS